MKGESVNKLCVFIFFAVCLLPTSLPAQNAAPPAAVTPPNKDVVAVQAVIAQIRDALVRAQKTLKGKQLPPLASIDLTLKTVVLKEAGGTFKLWIISFGATRENDQTQSVQIHLTPPSPDNPTKVGAASLTDALESAIVNAAEAAQQSGTDQYPLLFSGLTLELDFTVQTAGNGSVSIPVITPITVDLSGKVSKNATQTIKVVFQDPKTNNQKQQ
jgi:hypothetical protein